MWYTNAVQTGTHSFGHRHAPMQPCDTASTGDAHSPTLGGLDVAPVSSGVCGPLCLSESSAYIRRRI